MAGPDPALIDRLARSAQDLGVQVGVAESLTAGLLANTLGAAPDASRWFAGGVVAYSPDVKFSVLGVTPGPVNTARCAREMGRGAIRLLDVDLALALTGVGGPGPDEGVLPGTVYLACVDRAGEAVVETHCFPRSPSAVVEESVAAAVRLLDRCLRAHDAPPDDDPVSLLSPWSDCRR